MKQIIIQSIKLLSQSHFCVPWNNSWYCSAFPSGYGSGTGNLSSLGNIINSLLSYIFIIGGLILLFMIIASGYSLLTSAGNPEGIEKGKKRLTTSILGFVIIIAAYWIWQLVALFLGFGTAFPSP